MIVNSIYMGIKFNFERENEKNKKKFFKIRVILKIYYIKLKVRANEIR